MNQIIKFLFPPKSHWIDVATYDSSGYYYHVQMRYRLDNNKKEFRKVKIGFVNDFSIKAELYQSIKKNNASNP